MGVQAGDRPRGGAPARPARGWRPAALVAVAAVAILLASGAGRDSHPPQGPETRRRDRGASRRRAGGPLGGKLYPPRYDTLDYDLNQLVARHEGRDAAPGTPATVAGRVFNVVVSVDPAHVHGVASYLREQGAGVAEPRPGAEYLSAAVPLSALADLADRPGVQMVMVEPPIQRFDGGIAPHGADFWHDPGWYGGNGNDSNPNNDGSNVKIGIIDTGFVGYQSGLFDLVDPNTPRRDPPFLPTPTEIYCIVEGDTPGIYVVLTDIQDCETSLALTFNYDFHGTWVTELVYDIAPGADYYLARVDLPSHFQEAMTWLIAKDVDVISTSLGRAWEGPGDGTSPYGNSWLSQVNRAVDAGIFVAVAGGNGGAGSWYGTFRDSDSDSDSDNVMEWDDDGDECHRVSFSRLTFYRLRLRWEDDWNGADDDLDIYLRGITSTGTSTSTTHYMSEETQNGAAQQDPYEQISLLLGSTDPRPTSYCLVIERESGAAPNWVQLVIEAEGSDPGMEHVTEGYSITSPGETTKAGVLTVGAASVLTTSTIESYSARGPLPPASTVIKPDIVGVDNVRLSTFGNTAAEGTSFATPHVAGLAALVTWTWERSMSRGGPWEPVTGAILDSTETSVYTPVTGDVGYYLRAITAYTDAHSPPDKSRVAVSTNSVLAAPGSNLPPAFTDMNPTRSVAENARADALVGGPVTATDPDGNRGEVLLRSGRSGRFGPVHD